MAGRRANGEGSISRRKDGRWEAALYVHTASGIRKRIRLYGATRQQVSTRLSAELNRAAHGVPAPDRSWRLDAFLDYWLETIVKMGRSPATYAQCEMISRLYLKPGLGTVTLTRLSPWHVQGYANGLLQRGHSVPKIQIIRKVLSAAMTAAMREDLITRNVARVVLLPKYQPKEVVPWTAEDASAFLTATRNEQLYPAFVLLLLYGMRRGEVLGLRWLDIDFDKGIIRLRQQVQRVGRQVITGPLKTRNSRRTLPLLPMATEAFSVHRIGQLEAQERAGSSWETPVTGELVFATKTGRPIEPSNLVRSFRRNCRTHGLRVIRVHDTRHTAGTLLKDLGVPIRDAQLILGHAKASTTQEIYEHDTLASRELALGKVEALFAQSAFSDKTRSRQLSRQGTSMGRASTAHLAVLTGVTRGAGDGTLTRGLVLGKTKHPTVPGTLTEVRQLVRARYELMLLGAAAVMCSRQEPDCRASAIGHQP